MPKVHPDPLPPVRPPASLHSPQPVPTSPSPSLSPLPGFVSSPNLNDDTDRHDDLVTIGQQFFPSQPEPDANQAFEVLSSPVIVCRRNSVSSLSRERSLKLDDDNKNAEVSSPVSVSSRKNSSASRPEFPRDKSENLRLSLQKRNLGPNRRGSISAEIEQSVFGPQASARRSSIEMMDEPVSEPVVVRGSESDQGGLEMFVPSDTPARQYSMTIGDAVILHVNTQRRGAQPTISALPLAEKGKIPSEIPENIFATAHELHAEHSHTLPRGFKQTLTLTISALGVVYGDIGTNMLFLLPSILTETPSEKEVLGIVSLILWLLVFVVGIKYGLFVLRADNNGEGGCFALLFQVISNLKSEKYDPIFVTIACVGAGLLIGDGVVTPSISILSAVEGIAIYSPSLHPAVVPITCAIILVLFNSQRFGTQKVGIAFGPIMFVWFCSIAAIGLYHVAAAPHILKAFNPGYAVTYLVDQGFNGFALMGAIVLCVCGAEAMYADLAHFGARAIRISWWCIVCPALFCCYLGQGALLLKYPELYDNPFFNGIPQPVFWPMLILATMATVIASQAMISAAFSLTAQAINLGYFPPVAIIHTNAKVAGQIYIPFVNNVIMVLCLILVVGFRSSAALSSAYGLAVSGDMFLTSFVFLFVMHLAWKWAFWKAIPVFLLFMLLDVFFATSALMKVPTGGYIPLCIAFAVFGFMEIWIYGSKKVSKSSELQGNNVRLEDFVATIVPTLVRPQSTAMFLSTTTTGVPVVLTEYIKHTHVLPTTVYVLVFQVHKRPMIPDNEKIKLEHLDLGIYRLIVNFGFMEQSLSLDDALALAVQCHRLHINRSQTSFWLFKQDVLPSPEGNMFNKVMVSGYNMIRGNLMSAATRLQFPLSRTVELARMEYV